MAVSRSNCAYCSQSLYLIYSEEIWCNRLGFVLLMEQKLAETDKMLLIMNVLSYLNVAALLAATHS